MRIDELQYLKDLRQNWLDKAKLLMIELRRHSAAVDAEAHACEDCAYELDTRINELRSELEKKMGQPNDTDRIS